MRKLCFIAITFAAYALVSCQREELTEPDRNDGQVEIVPGEDGVISITAGFESQIHDGETKTHLSGGSKILWSSGDNAIYVFDSKGGKNKFTSTETGPAESRTFTGTITSGSEIEYVLWTGKGKDEVDESRLTSVPGGSVGGEKLTPGNDGAVVDWDYTKSGGFFSSDIFEGSTLAVLNPQNISTTNTFAGKANITIMKMGDKAFRNVFGYIRFTVPKGADGNAAIKSVQFSADEYMAGKIQIDYSGDDPVASIVEGTSKSVTVNMRWNPSTSRYEDGTFYAVLPPGTYKNLKITVTPFSNGASSQNAATGTPFVIKSSRDVVIKRGLYTDAGTLPAEKKTSDVFSQQVQILTGSVGGLCVDGNTLYAGSNAKIYVYDISIPMSPKLSTTVSLYGNARQICAYNGKLYVTARDTGVWIYDITNPLKPNLIRRYDTVELATGIDVAGDCMFVGQRQNGVEFVDVSDPSSPEHIRLIETDESQSVFYRDGYLYSGEWSSGMITIFNAKDLGNIQKLKTISLQGYGDGLWISGNRLYASTGHHHRNDAAKEQDGDGHGMEIWDLTDPENPTRISRVEFDVFYRSGIDYWLPRPSGDGKTIFCGDVFNGLYVVDATDEANPEIIEHWEPASNTPDNKKIAVTSLALAEGVVYVATSGDGLMALKTSRALPCTRDRGTSPTNPSARYKYSKSSNRYVEWRPSKRGAVHDVAHWGDAFFVACGDAGLSVVKVTRSSSWWNTKVTPELYSTLDIPFAGGVAVRGDRLYVAQGADGIGVYSISEGPVLTRIATIKDELSDKENQRYSCWVSAPNDKYVVNANRYGGYQFIAIGGTEENPNYTYLGSKSQNLNYARYISEEVCSNDRLPYATRDGLFWIDLSSTSSVSVSSMISDIKSSITCGVTNFRNGDALITRDGKIFIVGSGATSVTSEIASNDGFKGIPRWDGNNTLLITNHLSQKFSKVNISNTSSPSVTFTESVNGNPEPGIIVDGKVYVPCGYQGLLIEK